MKEFKSFKELAETYSKMAELKTRCKRCGCVRLIGNNREKSVCVNCGNYIFKDDKEEFKYRLKESMLRKGK